jgi:hypothetical protein
MLPALLTLLNLPVGRLLLRRMPTLAVGIETFIVSTLLLLSRY